MYVPRSVGIHDHCTALAGWPRYQYEVFVFHVCRGNNTWCCESGPEQSLNGTLWCQILKPLSFSQDFRNCQIVTGSQERSQNNRIGFARLLLRLRVISNPLFFQNLQYLFKYPSWCLPLLAKYTSSRAAVGWSFNSVKLRLAVRPGSSYRAVRSDLNDKSSAAYWRGLLRKYISQSNNQNYGNLTSSSLLWSQHTSIESHLYASKFIPRDLWVEEHTAPGWCIVARARSFWWWRA